MFHMGFWESTLSNFLAGFGVLAIGWIITKVVLIIIRTKDAPDKPSLIIPTGVKRRPSSDRRRYAAKELQRMGREICGLVVLIGTFYMVLGYWLHRPEWYWHVLSWAVNIAVMIAVGFCFSGDKGPQRPEPVGRTLTPRQERAAKAVGMILGASFWLFVFGAYIYSVYFDPDMISYRSHLRALKVEMARSHQLVDAHKIDGEEYKHLRASIDNHFKELDKLRQEQPEPESK